MPRGPGDRKNSFSLERLKKTFPHARNFHSRLKFSFSVWKFHSRLKISIPSPVFLRSERGTEWKFHSGLKISFRIESLIFSILSLEIDFFSILGPSGCWTPRKNGPKSRLKCPESPFLGHFNSPKTGFLGHFAWLLGPFFRGGVKMAFFGL